jgi:hypothetical protein
MDGLIFSGKRRTFENFKNQIPNDVQPLFIQLRDYCISLGENVVEDVRMHRIVFGKSLTFRWFADLEPAEEGIFVKIQKSRKEPTITVKIQKGENFESIKNLLKEAFTSIH